MSPFCSRNEYLPQDNARQEGKKKMDNTPNAKRNKKSDKAKEKYEKNGKYSQKAIRAMEQLREKHKGQEKTSNKPK